MRGRGTESASSWRRAGVLVLGIAGCQQQSTPEEEAAQTSSKIVEQFPIDENAQIATRLPAAAPTRRATARRFAIRPRSP